MGLLERRTEKSQLEFAIQCYTDSRNADDSRCQLGAYLKYRKLYVCGSYVVRQKQRKGRSSVVKGLTLRIRNVVFAIKH